MNTTEQRSLLALLAMLAFVMATLHLGQAQDVPPAKPKKSFFDEIVSVTPSEFGGQHVHVHIPLIVSLELDTRPDHTLAKLDLSVLYVLVKVHVDRQQMSDGSRAGPVEVRVFGVPVYKGNKRTPPRSPPTPMPSAADMMNNFQRSLSDGFNRLPQANELNEGAQNMLNNLRLPETPAAD